MTAAVAGAGATKRPLVVAAVGVTVGLAVVAAVVRFAPAAAQALIDALGIDPTASPVVVELIYVVVIFGLMLTLAVAGGMATGIRTLAAGRRPGRAASVGFALGLSGVLASIGYAALAGTVLPGEAGGPSLLLIAALPVVALQVVAEEAYFRGWLQPLLARAIGPTAAVAVVALAFAALHLLGGAGGALALVNLVAGGVLFGLLAARGGGIAGATAAHFAWNATEQLAFGLDPNPGTGGFGALVDLELAGPALWGGSEQGLNASIGMTIALAAIVVPLLMWRRRATSPPNLAA